MDSPYKVSMLFLFDILYYIPLTTTYSTIKPLGIVKDFEPIKALIAEGTTTKIVTLVGILLVFVKFKFSIKASYG